MSCGDTQSRYLTIQEAAEFLRWRLQTVKNKISQGVLRKGPHYFRRRGEIVFKREALEAWVEGREGVKGR
jgi:excisionase family DNA binding protein